MCELTELRPLHGEADQAREALDRLTVILQGERFQTSDTISLTIGENTPNLLVPKSALEALLDVLAVIAIGDAVSVIPISAELTTQQAADILQVSRPHVVKLLENGDIAYRNVGTHRRVLAKSLIEYRDTDNQHRRSAADELTSLAQELDLA